MKFFSDTEKARARGARRSFAEGDVLFFGADKWEPACENARPRAPARVGDLLKLIQDNSILNFLWVVDFPLFAYYAHRGQSLGRGAPHPSTRPKAEDIALMEAGDFGKVRAVAYDVVLNGVELGGGSILYPRTQNCRRACSRPWASALRSSR